MSAVTPTVSIAIRAYRRRWLAEAVSSVLGQTYRDLELVIYDDAGDLKAITNEYNDDRLRYHRAERQLEASGRFMAAVALCHGQYIGVLDDDDRYEPEFVASLLQALVQDPEAGVAFCRTTWESNGRRFVPTDSRPPGRQPLIAADMLSRGWTVSPSHMLIRKAALDDAERTQPMPDGVAPDVFVNVRTAVAGWRHVLVDAPLVRCRWHPDQISRASPTAYDIAVKTWRTLELSDPALSALRDRRLARALLVRSLERLRAGEAPRARDDLRAAAQVCPSAWRGWRWLMHVVGAWSPAGSLAARVWLSHSPRGRRRLLPPVAIGDR